MILESYFYLWLGLCCLYLNVACQSKLADQTSNIWKILRSKSMSRSQYLYSLCKVFVSILPCRNVLILFLKQAWVVSLLLPTNFLSWILINWYKHFLWAWNLRNVKFFYVILTANWSKIEKIWSTLLACCLKTVCVLLCRLVHWGGNTRSILNIFIEISSQVYCYQL